MEEKPKKRGRPCLDIKDLSFSFGDIEILKDITLDFERGSFVGIVGPNGAGKTTLLKCALGLLTPKRGKITLEGRDIRSLTKREQSRAMGYVPQADTTTFSVPLYEAVLLGRRPHIDFALKKRDFEVVDSLVRELELSNLADRSINELSGGEKQKVFIARALAQEPTALLLDEPTSALDLKHQIEVLSLLMDLVESQNKLVVVVMHDIHLASRYADCLVMLKGGRIHSLGPPKEVITEETLFTVYEIESSVNWTVYGPQIDVIRPVYP